MPKTAYRSNCRDKRTDCGSHPQPGTPVLDHCALLGQVGVRNLARVTINLHRSGKGRLRRHTSVEMAGALVSETR